MRGGRSLVAHRFFAAQLDFAVTIHVDHLDHDLVTFLNLVAYCLNAAFTDLRDVNEAVGAQIPPLVDPGDHQFGRFVE